MPSSVLKLRELLENEGWREFMDTMKTRLEDIKCRVLSPAATYDDVLRLQGAAGEILAVLQIEESYRETLESWRQTK